MSPLTVPTRSRLGRSVCGVLLVASLASGPVSVQAAPGTDPQTTSDLNSAIWAITLDRATLYSGPSEDAEIFGPIPAFVTLQVLGYDGDWAHVYNPRTRTDAFLPSDELAPGEAPSRYLLMQPPALGDGFETRGVVTDGAPLSLYPTWDDDAAERGLNPNTWLNLTGSVDAADGTHWYRTDTGDFVPSDAVFLPERATDFTGHWVDVNLSTPSRVTAYEGEEQVNSFLAIRGAGSRPTPSGVFTILRRVANETMNSDTIGIPRFGPGGYYLTNVLWTQYFTGDGASFHYNYWSSAWGYPGSHGCLGLTYADSSWLWEWAHVGTPIIIHY
jgi:hypothetical protein